MTIKRKLPFDSDGVLVADQLNDKKNKYLLTALEQAESEDQLNIIRFNFEGQNTDMFFVEIKSDDQIMRIDTIARTTKRGKIHYHFLRLRNKEIREYLVNKIQEWYFD